MAAKVMQLVNDLIGQGRWDEAHSVLIRYSTQQPNDPDICYQLGLLCYTTGKAAEAEQHFRKALSVRTDNADYHYHLGLSLLKDDRPAEAMAAFRDACELRPDFAVGHLHWGIALSLMGSYRGAIGQYNQALKISPQLVAAHLEAGIASYKLGQYDDAVQYFRTASSMDPNLSEAFSGLGMSLVKLGQPGEALPCFQKAFDLDGSSAATQRNWAAALAGLGQTEEAIKHYQAAIGLGPKGLAARERALVYNDWGVCLYQQGAAEESSEKLRHAVDVDPALFQCRMNLGMVYTALKEHEQAAECFDRALEIDPEAAQAYLHSGVAYLFTGQYEQAVERFGEAQARGLQHPAINLWMGYAQLALGNLEVAERHFQRTAQEDPQNYLVFDGWGNCLALLNRHNEALDKYAQCLRLKANYALCHLHAARSLESLGRTNEARGEYRIALQQDPACLGPEKESLDTLMQGAHYDLVLKQSLKLLDIAPSDRDVQLAMARALRAQNRLGECLEVLNGLIRDNPDSGPAHGLLGQVYLAQGKLSEADEQFRAASLLFEGDAALYYSWGKTLALLGLNDMAVEKFEKASEIDPYEGDVYEAWGAALKVLGRFQEAAEVYKRASEYI